MNPFRRQRYLNVIHELLASPPDEEERVLQAHPDLLDDGLWTMMEAYAVRLMEQGQHDAAQRLRNLSQSLTDGGQDMNAQSLTEEEIHVRPQFLGALLTAVIEHQGDDELAQAVLDEHVEWIDEATIEMFLGYVRAQIQNANSNEQSIAWATASATIGHLLQEYLQGSRTIVLEWAIGAYETALQVWTREDASPNWARTHNNLGGVYAERLRGERAENLERAIQAFEAALEVWTRETAPRDWAQARSNLGSAYWKRIRGDRADNIEQAIEAYEEVLEFYTYTSEPYDSYDWARVQTNLGGAYAERIREKQTDNVEKAIAAFEAALEVYTRELEVYTREDAPYNWATIQNRLGAAHLIRAREQPTREERADDFEQAIAAFEAALTVHTREAAPHDWATAQNNLGSAYRERVHGKQADNLERAVEACEAARQVWAREVASHRWASVQNNLGLVYQDRIYGSWSDNTARAVRAYDGALEVFQPDTDPRNALQVARKLASLYQRTEHWTGLRETLRTAIEAVETSRDEVLDDQRRREIIGESIDVYNGVVEACLHTGRPGEALAYTERSRSRTLADLLHGRDIKPSPNVPEALIHEDEMLRRRIRAFRRTIQQENAGTFGDGAAGLSPDFGVDHFDNGDRSRVSPPQTLESERQDLERTLRAAVRRRREVMNQIGEYDPTYRQSLSATPVQFDDIARLATEQDTAIVEWYQTDERLHAFIVTPGARMPTVVSLETDAWEKAAKSIQRYVDGYGRGWRNGSDSSDLSALIEELSERLRLRDIIAEIPDSFRSILLIPHRTLHLLPLHAFPVGSPKEAELLLDRFPNGARYAPCAFLAGITGRLKRTRLDTLWAAENPTGDLAFTELEVTHLQRHFETASVLRRDQAVKSALHRDKSFPESHCSHFACHGRFRAKAPITSHLVLARSELTLGEIFELRLAASRLTVLSACNTGIVDFSSLTDEYVGLPSGFLFAGSQAVVSSLWRIADISTAILMMDFYDRLAMQRRAGQTLSVSNALCDAQQWLRRATVPELRVWVNDRRHLSARQRGRLRDAIDTAGTGRDRPFADPVHWAAFCAIGD